MASLLLIVFILQLALHIVNTVGANSINDALWLLYNKLPTPTSNAYSEQLRLKREILRLKRGLNGVSAQDEFSKWAKLRRQHDKAVADYDKLVASMQSSQSSFNTQLNAFRLIAINGVKLFIQFWYSKSPLFWIPKGWLPFYVEWLLAFPRAPTGSVSIYVWSMACTAVIQMLGDAVVAGFVLMMGGLGRQEKGGKMGVGAGAGSEGEKKKDR